MVPDPTQSEVTFEDDPIWVQEIPGFSGRAAARELRRERDELRAKVEMFEANPNGWSSLLSERNELRAEVARMRPVVEAVSDLFATCTLDHDFPEWNALVSAWQEASNG